MARLGKRNIEREARTIAAMIGASGAATGMLTGEAASAITPDAAGSSGVSEYAAREDHIHEITCAAGVAITPDASSGEGTAVTFSRADHAHAITCAAPGANSVSLAASGEGTAASFARSDHNHSLSQAIAPTWTGKHIFNGSMALGGSTNFQTGANTSLQSDDYASQTTGWRITDAGAADFRYFFADEMHVRSFITDLEQALAGGQIISKSVAVIGSAFALPAAGGTATLVIEDIPNAGNQAVFQSGDMIRLRQFSHYEGTLAIADAWGTVSDYTDSATPGLQTWKFWRSGTPNEGGGTGTILAKSLALDYGVSGNGYYEVNAIDGLWGSNSPYAQCVTWTGHPAATTTLKMRIGNLAGITDPALNPTGYGLYSDNAYLKGVLSAANGAININNNGIQVTGTAAWDNTRAYLIVDASGTALGGLSAVDYDTGPITYLRGMAAGTSSAVVAWAEVAGTTTGYESRVTLLATDTAFTKEMSIDLYGANDNKRMKITGGPVLMGDTANAKSALGLTINQGANDDEIISLKSSDVSHPFTDFTEADTYGYMRKPYGTSGGLQIFGMKANTGGATPFLALALSGRLGENAGTAKSTGGHGVVWVDATITNGTAGVTSVNANGNLFSVSNNSSVQFIVDAEGDTHRNGLDNTYDAYDDLSLCEAFDTARRIDANFKQWQWDKHDDLIEAGILSEGGFYNESALLRLHNGAIRQLAARYEREIKQLHEEMDALKRKLLPA